jgi:hypothetical protein
MTTTNTLKRRRGIFAPGPSEMELPPGCLPCESCGIAVADPARASVGTVTLRAQHNGLGRPMGSDIDIPTARCAACFRRLARAGELMHDHPAVAREHGNVGTDRADAMLALFEALGDSRGRMIEPLLATDEGLRDLLAATADFGPGASWAAGSARPGICESRRFGHVREALLNEVNRAHRDLVLRRMESPAPISPPANDRALPGCGFCGIGELVVKPSNAADAWGPLFRILPGVVGGRGPDRIAAHLCPECRASLRATDGGIGMRAIEHAILKSFGYEPMTSWRVELTSVRAFAALPPGSKPSTERWAHLGAQHLARLEADLVTSPYVRMRVS